MEYEKLKDLTSGSRRGTCLECGATSENDPTLVRLRFGDDGATTSVCLCGKCLQQLDSALKYIETDQKVHELKILPKYFQQVLMDDKKFELRKNDRDFHVGDMIRLRSYADGEYTGGDIMVKITYILSDCPEYGLKDGYCILGFRRY